MPAKRFLVSYIRDNQPESVELEVDAETLTPEQLRPYLESRHLGDLGKISDIQIMGIHHPPNKPHPGHYQQPEP